MSTAEAQAEHRSFLNKYYGISRYFYDLTRKYYLFGRDTALQRLALDTTWTALLEVGPGTGRNLRKLKKARPAAFFGGLEASDAMLEHAQTKCPWAKFAQGFAENVDQSTILDIPPDRILYSYCLSMVQDKRGALEASRSALAPGGEVWVVDFGDFEAMPGPFEGLMQKWLQTFHVHTVDPSVFEGMNARIEWGPGRYYFIARVPALPEA